MEPVTILDLRLFWRGIKSKERLSLKKLMQLREDTAVRDQLSIVVV